MTQITTIPVKKETRDKLKRVGFKSETYDDIIIKLVEAYKRAVFYDRQRQILETEEFVPLEKV